jgi:hypothetical protein
VVVSVEGRAVGTTANAKVCVNAKVRKCESAKVHESSRKFEREYDDVLLEKEREVQIHYHPFVPEYRCVFVLVAACDGRNRSRARK